MDPDTPNPHAIGLAERLRGAPSLPKGSYRWSCLETGTECILRPDGVYEVYHQPSELPTVPLIVGFLGPHVTREFLADPMGQRARRAAANVISVVDEG